MPAGSIAAISQPEPLTQQHVDVFAKQIGQPCFHRRVAAAVQHQFGIAAEQSRRIDAAMRCRGQCHVARMRDQCLGVAIDPATLHGGMRSAAGEAARPPAPAARLLRTFVVAGLGDDGFRAGCRCRRCRRRRGFRGARARRRLADRSTFAAVRVLQPARAPRPRAMERPPAVPEMPA